jgi:hypothetical protein
MIQGYPLCTLLLSIVLEIIAIAIKQKSQGIQMEKEKVKLSIPIPDNMILYLKNPKDCL